MARKHGFTGLWRRTRRQRKKLGHAKRSRDAHRFVNKDKG